MGSVGEVMAAWRKSVLCECMLIQWDKSNLGLDYVGNLLATKRIRKLTNCTFDYEEARENVCMQIF